MKLVQMAYLDLREPPPFDTPQLTLRAEDVEVIWAARWADPRGPWTIFRKQEVQAALVFADADIERELPRLPLSASADPEARTPAWLSCPYHATEPNSKNGDLIVLTSEVTELVIASAPIRTSLERDESGNVLPPPDTLRSTLKGIEFLADLLAVTHRSSRRLGSPKVPICLLPETDAETAWLLESRGISGLERPEIAHEPEWRLDLAHIPRECID